MPSPWKRFRYRLEWIGLVLATKLIPLLSRRAATRNTNRSSNPIPALSSA
jgi:hypothetical protein